jgi:hypothetical protein
MSGAREFNLKGLKSTFVSYQAKILVYFCFGEAYDVTLMAMPLSAREGNATCTI